MHKKSILFAIASLISLPASTALGMGAVKIRFVRAAAGIAMLLIACGAQAVPVLWTLHPGTVIFGDGGTASGSFVFDADTNTLSNINITTTSGSSFTGEAYTQASPLEVELSEPVPVSEVFETDYFPGQAGETHFFFVATPEMTNAGGWIYFLGGGEFICLNEEPCDQEGNFQHLRTLVSGAGAAFGVVIPIPAAAWLFGSALLGLISIKRGR